MNARNLLKATLAIGMIPEDTAGKKFRALKERV
jgi:hypothetical protein